MCSLLLLHSSTGDREGLGDVQKCQTILAKTEWYAESVLFAQTYKPSLAAGAVAGWRENLEKPKKARAAKLIGLPSEDDDLFPEWNSWLKLEAEGGSAAEIAPHSGKW